MSEQEEIQIIGGLWVQYRKACREKTFVEVKLNMFHDAVQQWGRWTQGMGLGEHPNDRLPSGGEIEALVKQIEDHDNIVRDLRGRLEVLGCL